MFKITINSQKHGQVWLTKETQEEVDSYLSEIHQSCHWGKPEHTIVVQEAKEAILDEEGNELEPAQELIEEVVPAEYTIEIIEDYVDQSMVNAEALAYLAETDWIVIRSITDPDKPVPQEILVASQAARDKIIK